MADVPSFAAFLRAARERSGLTQATLASRCRLTGSYLSLLESGRKPAPSDEVVRSLAGALGIPAAEALRVAHLDRAPEDLRRDLERLRRRAARERALRERTAEALFPFSLWGLLPPGSPRGLRPRAGADLDAEVVAALDRILDAARGAPDAVSFRRASREALRGLPEAKRRRVLEAAPALVEGAAEGGPVLVPAPDPGLPPDVRPGDLLLVDPAAAPAEGDVVLVEAGGRSAVRRFAPGTPGVRGVVLEVRRRPR